MSSQTTPTQKLEPKKLNTQTFLAQLAAISKSIKKSNPDAFVDDTERTK